MKLKILLKLSSLILLTFFLNFEFLIAETKYEIFKKNFDSALEVNDYIEADYLIAEYLYPLDYNNDDYAKGFIQNNRRIILEKKQDLLEIKIHEEKLINQYLSKPLLTDKYDFNQLVINSIYEYLNNYLYDLEDHKNLKSQYKDYISKKIIPYVEKYFNNFQKHLSNFEELNSSYGYSYHNQFNSILITLGNFLYEENFFEESEYFFIQAHIMYDHENLDKNEYLDILYKDSFISYIKTLLENSKFKEAYKLFNNYMPYLVRLYLEDSEIDILYNVEDLIKLFSSKHPDPLMFIKHTNTVLSLYKKNQINELEFLNNLSLGIFFGRFKTLYLFDEFISSYIDNAKNKSDIYKYYQWIILVSKIEDIYEKTLNDEDIGDLKKQAYQSVVYSQNWSALFASIGLLYEISLIRTDDKDYDIINFYQVLENKIKEIKPIKDIHITLIDNIKLFTAAIHYDDKNLRHFNQLLQEVQKSINNYDFKSDFQRDNLEILEFITIKNENFFNDPYLYEKHILNKLAEQKKNYQKLKILDTQLWKSIKTSDYIDLSRTFLILGDLDKCLFYLNLIKKTYSEYFDDDINTYGLYLGIEFNFYTQAKDTKNQIKSLEKISSLVQNVQTIDLNELSSELIYAYMLGSMISDQQTFLKISKDKVKFFKDHIEKEISSNDITTSSLAYYKKIIFNFLFFMSQSNLSHPETIELISNLSNSANFMVKNIEQHLENTNKSFEYLDPSTQELIYEILSIFSDEEIGQSIPELQNIPQSSLKKINSTMFNLHKLIFKTEQLNNFNISQSSKKIALNNIKNRYDVYLSLKENKTLANIDKLEVKFNNTFSDVYKPKKNELLILFSQRKSKLIATVIDDNYETITWNLNSTLEENEYFKTTDNLIEEIRKLISKKSLNESYKNSTFDFEASYKIYDQLFWFLDYYNMKEIKNIFISGSGIFKNLPFTILVSDLNNTNSKDIANANKVRWLFQDYNLINLPNPFFKPVNEKIHTKRYLAFAVSEFNYNASSEIFTNANIKYSKFNNLPNLPNTLKEVDKIRSILGSSKKFIFKNNNATEKKLRSFKNKNFDIIHFATHSFTSDAQEIPLILLNSEDISDIRNDGIVDAFDIVDYNITSDLVILSSCSSAISDSPLKYGYDSLMQSFFINKAKVVFANTWPINDEFTSLIIPEILRRYSENNLSFTETLRLILIDNLSQNKIDRLNPYLWSSYQIYAKDIY